MKLIIRILVNALALWITTLILPAFQIDNFLSLIIVAALFGLVNALIRPIVKLFTLPINVVTLGLFTLVINAAMLGLTALLSGNMMNIEGGFLEKAWWCFLGAIIISIVSAIANWILPDKK
jgi:putative membrane protein